MGGQAWHERTVEDVAAALRVDPACGLDAREAARRLRAGGPNRLPEATPPSALRVLWRQIASVVVLVLLGAAGIAVALGETLDAVAILAIIGLHATLGFAQEYRAERAVRALARLTAPRARVLRAGVPVELAAAGIVRGDVLLLDAGDLVAADARLVDASRLRTDEAPLTGESEPVGKRLEPCPGGTPVADRRNMVFLGTSVVAGSGRALVVETGTTTELGRVATLLETATRPPTPLERELDTVGRWLLVACLGIVLLVVGLGLRRGQPVVELLLAAASLAVAAIPEGLPAVVTIALALGVQRMARRHTLVRRLPAVETLGATQVVCSDKTGTITVGAMTARRLVTWSHRVGVTGTGWSTEGQLIPDDAALDPAREPAARDSPRDPGQRDPAGDAGARDLAREPEIRALLEAAVAASDARLGERDGEPTVVGDPTEGALLVVAAKAGIDHAGLDARLPRLGTVPFDSDRRRMTVVRRRDGAPCAFVKGAPEAVLERVTHVRTATGTLPLDAAGRARLLAANDALAAGALRVLAVAERPLDAWPVPGDVEAGLVILGLVGMQDPPRPEARAAVAACRRAGMRPVMITGDHPDTARAIAREVGILGPGDEVLDGPAVDALDDAGLEAAVAGTAVYARVTAEHKLRIVRAWQRRDAVVAMTGDGVNDAPALREADIGVAMGRSGTEVTKAAADMIIVDDDFATIVAAVEEGRGIWDNVQKTLAYLITGNAAELAVMLVAGLLGWPLPLLPIHLLWINIVTDGLPAIALATDPPDRDLLLRPPRPRGAGLADRRLLVRTLLGGGLAATVALLAFAHAHAATGSVAMARDAAFTVLVCEELLRSLSARSPRRPMWRAGLFANVRLVVIVLAGLAIQVALHHAPALQRVFSVAPVPPWQWAAWLALATVPLSVLEALKLVEREPPPAATTTAPCAGATSRPHRSAP